MRTGFAGRRPILQKAGSEKGTPMKAVCGTIFALAAFILFAFGGDSKHQLIGSGAVPMSFTNCGPAGNGFPCMFWGVQVHDLSSYPLQVPYGQFRGWDGANANWPAIAANCNPSSPPTSSCFDWTNLDAELTNVRAQANVNDVFYTLSRTPPWAVTQQQQNDPNCNYYALGSEYHGACYPPIDVADDGSGTDQIWRNWVAAIALHVNAATYAGGHIKYWEIWNEIYRSSTLQFNPFGPPYSFEGSYNQLVRMAQDANCIIAGRVQTITATGESCQTVLGTVGLTSSLDPNAVIVSPSTSVPAAAKVLENFLRCDMQHKATCTTGGSGFNAVDVINVHAYASTKVETPEYVAGTEIPKVFSIAGGKPVWSGEGSWGNTAAQGNIWQDPYAQAGFIPRFFALYWSAGVSGNFWYGYDFVDDGQLFDPTQNVLLQPQANAWILTYNWLSGAVPMGSTFCQNSGTIYNCDFKEAVGGRVARLVWDSSYGQNCSEMSVPIICGDTSYNVPLQFSIDWIDLSGTAHPASSNVIIGANPILLEGPAR